MSGNHQSGSSSGPLRTTLEVDRLLVQQIYIRTTSNTPISTGYVLLADGQGGIRFGPAAIQEDYFTLSSMISAGTAIFTSNLSTNFTNEMYTINYAFSNIQAQVLSTFFTTFLATDAITQNVNTLSNLIINISSYSTFVQSANLSLSTLSSYIYNISQNYTTNVQTVNSNNTLLDFFTSTTSSFSSNYSTLQNQSFTIFNTYSSFQSQLYLNNFSTVSSQYNYLLVNSALNYSTLSTTLANQQSSYQQALSTVMSSYVIDYSTILGNEINFLNVYDNTLSNSVSSLSTLFFSIATYSLSTNLVAINSTLSSSVNNNISTLSGQLSTIQGTSLTSLGSTLSTTQSLTNTLNSLSTSLQVTYSSLTVELSITQTRGINSQLYNQFFQLGITQSSILANNQSSINYLSTVIGQNYSTATYQFSTLTNINYSTLAGIGYSSIVIANTQISNSTNALLASTLTSTNLFLVTSSNLQSAFLFSTLSTSYGLNLSSITGNLQNVNNQASNTQLQLFQSLSTFSTSVYSYIGTISNTISSLTITTTSNVSNWTTDTVSNSLSANLGTISNTFTIAQSGTVNPAIIAMSNSLLGLISTTFSTLSTYATTFAGINTNNTFTNTQTFQGAVTANSGIYTQFFQISNIISSYIYQYTGQTQYYKPNPFANQVLIQLWGAGGAAGTNTNGGGGSYVEGTFSVDPTQIYNINIGAGGTISTVSNKAFNGGGAGIPTLTGGGGGATNIYFGNNNFSLISNVAIAGGGGGGGYVSTFTNWNAQDIINKGIVVFKLNNSSTSNQYLGLSTFSSYQTVTGQIINYTFSSLSTYTSYNLSSYSTTIYNLSTMSTNHLINASLTDYTIFNFSTYSTISFNYSTLSTYVLSPYLIYNLSTMSTNYAAGSVLGFVSNYNYSTFNLSTFSTLNYYTTSSFLSAGTAFLSTAIVPFLNSTIYLTCGSWGGPGGITIGASGLSPYSTITNNDFALGGIGGGQLYVASPPLQSNIITRNVKTIAILSTVITQSTYTNYVVDFIPQLMGYSPYVYQTMSTNLITTSNNSSNYTIISTNVYQDTLFSNYYSTVINLLPTKSSTLAFYYTVRDLYSLQNTYAPNSLPLAGLTTRTDYTTDKTPTAIYSADLSFTLTQFGSPYGIAVHLIPFPFDIPDPFLLSTAVRYISSVVSTIQNTRSVTNTTGLKYYNMVGSISSYNGTFLTEGIYGNQLDRYIFQYISTIGKYNYNILTPSTLNVNNIPFSTTGWLLSSITDQSNYNINTSSIISSVFRQIYAGCNYINMPTVFAPYQYDAFFPITATSTLTSLVNQGVLVNYSTLGDFFTQFFEKGTNILSQRKMYNIFVSSAGPNGTSLINSLPITFSTLYRNPPLSTANSFTSYNLSNYINKYFTSQDFTNQNFAVNDISFTIKTLADFPTVKLYIQTISTIQYFSYQSVNNTISNVVYYPDMGKAFLGGDAVSSIYNTDQQQLFTGTGGGGGGGGLFGGEAGAYTAGGTFIGNQLCNWFIGGGGGGGGSSYISPLTGIGNSLPGQTIYSGFSTHPLASLLGTGQAGIDSNSFNNYLLNSTFNSITTLPALKNGGNGLAIITEYVDPFKITISTATQNFTPLRIDATTNEVVVNKLVISSAQIITLGPNNPSTSMLDFANYQQFYITLRDHVVSSFHIIPMSTISSPSMNFQTGNIYLNISTFSTNAFLDLSSFKIETTWSGNSPGIISSYANKNTYLFEYSIFNSNIYLTSPRIW